MNQRTRYFLIGSALVVVTGLCTGVVAYYAGGLPMGRPAGAVELSYLPEDVSGVAYADVQDIMKAGFSQRLRQMFPTGGDKDRLEAELGINLEKDIDSVMAALDASGPDQSVVLLRGRFDTARIEALATQHGATVTPYQGKRIFVAPAGQTIEAASTPAPAGAPAAGAVFLEPNLLALGHVAALQKAIDTSVSHQDITTNPAFMQFVSDVRDHGNAWIVGRADMLTGAPGMPEVVRSQLPPVQWFSVSATVDESVSGVLRAETRDDQSAEQLRQILTGAIAAGRAFSGADPTVQAALGALQASGRGNDVQLRFLLTPEILEHMHASAATGRFGRPFGGAPAAPIPPTAPAPPAAPALQK
jgi:hypothetical protein